MIGVELAGSFRDALEKHRAAGRSLSVLQASSLGALEAYITELSAPRDRALWCNPNALHRDSRWQHIRELAQAAVDALAQKQRDP